MEELQDTEFNDFMAELEDGFGNQTETETGEQPAAEDAPAEQSAAADEAGEEGEKEDGDGDTAAGEPAEASDAESFTLKVNKEERTYTREEVISLAQKGADYDRVKDQLATSRQTATELQTKLDSHQEAMEVLNDLAKDAGVDIPALLDNLRIGLLKKRDGLSEDAARERLLRIKAEKENETLKAAAKPAEQAEDGKQKAQRDLAQFRKDFPNVELTQELMDKLLPGVQEGHSLTDSYRQYDAQQKDARIAELERQLAAEKQNKENRVSSPGSQKDSGGKRTKDDFNDFMTAFK